MSQASRKGLHGQTSLISTHRRQKCTPPPKTSCLIPLERSLIHERPGGVLPLKPLGEQSCLSCVCLCSKRERDGVCKEGGHERKEVDQKIREEVLCRFSSVWKFRSRSSSELPSGQWKQRDKAPPFLETASCVVPCCIPQASCPWVSGHFSVLASQRHAGMTAAFATAHDCYMHPGDLNSGPWESKANPPATGSLHRSLCDPLSLQPWERMHLIRKKCWEHIWNKVPRPTVLSSEILKLELKETNFERDQCTNALLQTFQAKHH